MASYKRVFALILIIKLVTTSSAFRARTRIVPEGQASNGHDTVIGRRAPNGVDHVAFVDIVHIPAIPFWTVQHEETFHTQRQEIITQVRVEDVTMVVTGGRVQRINNGPGFQNVTLKFYSEWNSGIDKVVALYGI